MRRLEIGDWRLEIGGSGRQCQGAEGVKDAAEAGDVAAGIVGVIGALAEAPDEYQQTLAAIPLEALGLERSHGGRGAQERGGERC